MIGLIDRAERKIFLFFFWNWDMSGFRNRRVLDRLSGAVVQTKDKAEVG